ncbi:Imm51 family immunity protein [Paenibacillus ginsengarvi]|uniref:Tetratricopeptide repeat protein n=1 Tax=Paenibacillus ginsengarvi TaxID=400777 RepID=A0A3B0CLW8_9BACL|nr:Imm51 family immunity protein [Paenibacillus ginsengarvi]RKN86383.1 tetratricopeptide repeat protein [Paenibacillus ginsengarvi]
MERDYELLSHLARAMNNMERYEDALQLLLKMKDQGEQDPLWHFRLGYSFYYLKRYEEAEKAFEFASNLDPADESAMMFLDWSRQESKRLKQKGKQSVRAKREQSSDTGKEKDPSTPNLEPFQLVEHESGRMSVILNVGTYKEGIFQERADEGFEGSGYDWGSLAAVFLAERMPQLASLVHFDPEGSMFCAYADDREALQSFAIAFKEACEDDAVIRDLFSRAELD